MKPTNSFLIVLLTIGICACQPENQQDGPPTETTFDASLLQGTWAMTSYQPQDTNVMVEPPYSQIKIFTENRFFLINMNKDNHSFNMALGGIYTTKPDTFIESIRFYSGDDTTFVGYDLPYKCELSADNFSQSGIIPGSGTEDDPDLIIEETYKRLEPPIGQGKASIVGLWKLDSAAYDKMETAEPLPGGGETYKLITDKHFYAIQSNPNTGNFDGVVFGSYKMEDGKYVETIITNSRDSTLMGNVITFEVDLTKTSFHQNGSLSFEGNPNYKVEEFFTRIE